MFDNNSSENEILNKVTLFEEMISGNTFTFFDPEDFEKFVSFKSIEYFLEDKIS